MSIEKRITLYTLTIHKDDVSKDNKKLFDLDYLGNYLREVFSIKTECYFIMHDKDKEKDGTLKEAHIHLAIKFVFNGGKTFSRMKQIFPNSHIEEAFDWTNAVLYLTHETANAIKEGKYKYSRDSVVNVFNSDLQKYYEAPIYEPFNLDNIEEYFYNRKLRTIIDYGRVFGYNNIKPYWNMIKEIIDALNDEYRKYLREVVNDYGNDND